MSASSLATSRQYPWPKYSRSLDQTRLLSKDWPGFMCDNFPIGLVALFKSRIPDARRMRPARESWEFAFIVKRKLRTHPSQPVKGMLLSNIRMERSSRQSLTIPNASIFQTGIGVPTATWCLADTIIQTAIRSTVRNAGDS
jgi:hypothetical protein